MYGRSGAPSSCSVHRDRGSITLEAAVVLPLLLLVTSALLWGINVGITAVAMSDAVRTSARLIARGESAELVMARLQESLPEAEIGLRSRGPDVVIDAARFMSIPVPAFRGIGFTVSQSATAPMESS
jgi:hypothetical protein